MSDACLCARVVHAVAGCVGDRVTVCVGDRVTVCVGGCVVCGGMTNEFWNNKNSFDLKRLFLIKEIKTIK